ncbi:MAG TPA: FtsH protease activity modulator HflK [Steroidobacteraceae bacterium]|nr:FtsH protease activity modulator HflK [Steroidobacteraceae bacterium]
MAWNDSGGNPGGKRNPWGQRPDQGPPDLDEVVRNLQRRLSGLFGGGRGAERAAPTGGRGFGIGTIVLVLLAVWALTGLYKVDAAERAVVLRFGKFVGITTPGLRWHMPWPIETKQIINTGTIESFSDQTRMLTSDENLVDINLAVQFRRADPRLYAFNVLDPEATLREVSESAIREVIGRSRLDAVLESGRQDIVARTEELVQRTLNAYKTGIEVTTVNLQGVSLPGEVAPAQQDAIKAREDRDRLALEAQAYANDILPKAGGTAARRVQDAQAYKARKVANAEGETQRFISVLAEYERAPAVTRERLYLETVEEVLRSSKKILVDSKTGGSLLYLPIDKLLEQGRGGSRDEGTGSSMTVERPAAATGSSDDSRTRGSR